MAWRLIAGCVTGFPRLNTCFCASGKQGYRRTGRNEQFFYDGLVILALLCITILFEIVHHHARHHTGHLHGSTSTWMAHVTGHDELPPHEDPTPEHPTDFVSKLTWNEYYHHFSRQVPATRVLVSPS